MEQGMNLVLVSREEFEQTQAAQKQKEQEMKDLEKRVWESLENGSELDSVVGYLNKFKTAW